MKAVLTAILIAAALLHPSGARAGTVTVWMRPGGTGDGITQQAPAGSLSRAQATLTAVAPQGPAIVRMAPGTYAETGSVTWTVPGVTFEPWAYAGGGWAAVSAEGGYPVIDGRCAVSGYILVISAPDVRVMYVQFRNRLAGLVLDGPGGDRAVFYGDVFTRAGTAYCGGKGTGYAGLGVYRAQHWQVVNSHFTYLVNSRTDAYGGPGQIHGIYAREASYGSVTGNAFAYVSGDAVRVRAGANDNTISGNTFTRAGGNGYIGDWHSATEPASAGNTGTGNHWHGYYSSAVPHRTNFCYDAYPGFSCAPSRLLISGSAS